MKVTKEMSDAAVEVLAFFDYLSPDLLEKIPRNFVMYLKEIESFDHFFEYDPNKSLGEQGFSDDAIAIIGLLYKNYLCDDNQKKEYEKSLEDFANELEEEKRKKYNPDDLFKKVEKSNNNISNNTSSENSTSYQVALDTKKPSIFKRIFDKIKNIFKKTN